MLEYPRRNEDNFCLAFFYFYDVPAIWERGTGYKGTESANSSWQTFLTSVTSGAVSSIVKDLTIFTVQTPSQN